MFQREYRDLLTIAVGIVRDPALALDVVQDVALMVLEKGYGEDALKNCAAYLRSCVRHRAVDYVRRESRSAPMEPAALGAAGPGAAEPGYRRVEAEQWLYSYLGELSPDMREALAMHVLDGYTIEELAERMNIKPSTLRQRFRRIKGRIPRDALFHMLFLSMGL